MTHKLFSLVLINLSLIGTLVAGLPALAQETPVPYTISSPVSYNDGDPAQTVTLYLPEAASRKPLTLFLPYGQYFPELTDYFAGRGYTVLSVDLRENGDFLTEMQDTFCALAWAHTHAETYGFAPAQLVLVGGSMHGGLVSLLAMIDDATPYLEECPHALPETERVYGVITLAGVFDYSQEADFFAGFVEAISTDYMGGTLAENPARWAEASAITWIDGNEPPFLLLHGTADTNVNIHQSEIFAAALAEAGVEAEFVSIPRATHSSLVRDERAFAATEAFLGRIAPPIRPQYPGPTGPILFVSDRDGVPKIFVINADGSSLQQITDFSSGLPAWSPDGSQIAFIRDNHKIYIMDSDGANSRRLTEMNGQESHPAWSPDGTQIAFSSNRNGNDDIFVANSDGSSVRQLTDDSGQDGQPKWSPDGTQIAFYSDRDGNMEIYVMAADGSNQGRLTNNAFDDYYPAFSPDGATIAFTSIRDENTDIDLMNADGTEEVRITDHPEIDAMPVWSPDGRFIVFHSRRDGDLSLYIMNTDGSGVQLLVDNADHASWSIGANQVEAPILIPSTSADTTGNSAKIAFISQRDGNAEIYVMNPDGSDQQRLTFAAGRDFVSSWSPDGMQLAYSNDADGDWEIYIMDADGGNPRRLTDNTARDAVPAWSPDGTQIAFSSDRDGNDEIYVMDTDGGNVRRLTELPGSDTDPAWSPDGLELVFTSSKDGTPDIYVMTLESGEMRRLTNDSAYDGCPAFSPDGSRIAFMSQRQRQFAIYLVNADGSDPQALNIGDGDGWCPFWSPDGTQIAFYSYRPGAWTQGKSNSIFVVNVDGSHLQQLTETGLFSFHPRWWHPPVTCPRSLYQSQS